MAMQKLGVSDGNPRKTQAEIQKVKRMSGVLTPVCLFERRLVETAVWWAFI